MLPSEYLEKICRPLFDEFEREPATMHRAWAAIVALAHFADYLARSRNIRICDARKEVSSSFPNFDLITDIANASKHVVLDRGGRKREGYSVENIQSGPEAAFTDGTYFSDNTAFSDAKIVLVSNFNEEQVDLVHLCSSCLTSLTRLT